MRFRTYGIPSPSGRWDILTDTAFGIPYHRRDGLRYRYYLVCKCICGSVEVVRVDQLKSGISGSCGCLQKEKASKSLRKSATDHGESTNGWDWLLRRVCRQRSRCTVPESEGYHNYGGRGIEFRFPSVGEATAYYKTLPNCSRDLELDRIDNDGHYEVGNVRFVSHRYNMRNRQRRKT